MSATALPPWLSTCGLEGGREVEAELEQRASVPGQVRRELLLTSGLGPVDLGGGGCCRGEFVLLKRWGFHVLGDKTMSLRDIIRSLSPLPMEGMEEELKGSFRASLRVTNDSKAACSSWRIPMKQKLKLRDSRIHPLQHLPR